MQIDNYYTRNANGTLSFTREQASHFARDVADDFNPIHDVDAKRFCVPGDLLFAVTLSRIGLSQKMQVSFADMVTQGVELNIPEAQTDTLSVTDQQEKNYLTIACQGNHTSNKLQIEGLTKAYVEFSGKTFPHILVPLWAEQGVMINPDRPLVIYESMSIDLDHFDFQTLSLKLANTHLDVNGKRGNVTLGFTLFNNDQQVGRGEKKMVLSGLRPYEQGAIDGLIDFYNNRKITAEQ